MKKFLCSLLVACLSVSSSADSIDDIFEGMVYLAQAYQVDQILRILNNWVSQYPQCYEDVANISELVSRLQTELSSTSEFQDSVSSFLSQSNTDILGIQQNQALIINYLQNLDQHTMDVHNALVGWQQPIPLLLSDLNFRVDLVDQVVGHIYTYLYEVLSSISQSVDSLSNLSFDGASVEISNLADIGDFIKAALDEITVRVSVVGDLPVNVNVSSDFSFDYEWFSPVKSFHEKARSRYFTLDGYTRYFPSGWRFNSADSLDQIISVVDTEAHSYDILDFLCRCGNALVSQNEDMSMLLCQILGALKGDSPEKDELRGRAQSAVDDVQSDHDSLKSAFGVDSLQSAADRYFVDLNIDDKFDTDFLGFAHGAGNVCPEYVNIGPIPFSKIYASMSDYTLQLPTAGLLSFFDVCRQCFTVIWYLFFLTICIFLARFGWAFLKPVFGVISNILNW